MKLVITEVVRCHKTTVILLQWLFLHILYVYDSTVKTLLTPFLLLCDLTSTGPSKAVLEIYVRLLPSFIFFTDVIFLFSQDVEVIKVQRSHIKKITPKPPDSFPNGVPNIFLEEPKENLDSTARTTKNDLIHVSVLHLHMAEMQKILQKERE